MIKKYVSKYRQSNRLHQTAVGAQKMLQSEVEFLKKQLEEMSKLRQELQVMQKKNSELAKVNELLTKAAT